MSSPLLATLCAGGLLAAASAGAETYRILDGRLGDAETGASDALEGALGVSVFEPSQPGVPPSFRVDAFDLRAGARTYGPRRPVEFEGRGALWLEIADQIQFSGDAVEFARVRSGGEIVAVDGRELTFRFAVFRVDAPNAGRLVGHLADSLLPRRLSLLGTLYEVDQRFRLPRGTCPVLPPPPADGGGVIIGGGGASSGGVIVIGGDGGGLEVAGSGRLSGADASAIEGALVADGGSASAPTLAELGVTAPSGAQVTFDDAGSLTVSSEGDLLVETLVFDVPGLKSLTLVTPGTITIEGALEVPPDLTLTLNAGAIVLGSDPSDSPGDVVIGAPPPIFGIPLCDDLLPVFPADEREVGSFSLVASAAEQVEIDVRPARHGGSPHGGRHGIVTVAILGSEAFDIREIDERSLRLGPGEAEPTSRRGRERSHRSDVNRDGERDLVVRFDARDAGIEVGDTELCLFGETVDGAAIEGCDDVETKPEHGRRTHRGGDDDDDEPAESGGARSHGSASAKRPSADDERCDRRSTDESC